MKLLFLLLILIPLQSSPTLDVRKYTGPEYECDESEECYEKQ